MGASLCFRDVVIKIWHLFPFLEYARLWVSFLAWEKNAGPEAVGDGSCLFPRLFGMRRREHTNSRLVWTTKQDPVLTITAGAAAATEHNSSSDFRAGDQAPRDVKR